MSTDAGVIYTRIETKFGARYNSWYDEVRVNGHVLTPEKSRKVFNHSPDGFSWGYGGSGPSQLALAIMLEVTQSVKLSIAYYGRFRDEIIAKQPRHGAVIDIDMWQWLNDHGAELQPCSFCSGFHFAGGHER